MRLNRFLGTAFVLALMANATQGESLFPTITNRGGANADSFAAGGYVNVSTNGMAGNQSLGNWMLSTSVSTNDFINDGLIVGPEGIQYTMRIDELASTDVNQITFTTALPESRPQISISQSPYNDVDVLWNGGQFESSRMRMFWAGGESAMVHDPDNQLTVADGMQISSGMSIPFNNQVYNDEDSWQIDLPVGVDSVRVDWSSANPVANSDLTREWVTFNVTQMPVPEPSALQLIFAAIVGAAGFRRQ